MPLTKEQKKLLAKMLQQQLAGQLTQETQEKSPSQKKYDVLGSGALLVDYIVSKSRDFDELLSSIEEDLTKIISTLNKITASGLNEQIDEKLLREVLGLLSKIKGMSDYNSYLMSLIESKIPRFFKKIEDEINQYDIEADSTPVLNLGLLEEAVKKVMKNFDELGESVSRFVGDVEKLILDALESIRASSGMATPEMKRQLLKIIELLHMRKDAIRDFKEMNNKIKQIVKNSIDPLLEGMESALRISEQKKKEYITDTI